MIDMTATEPPRNWFLDLASAPTEDLLAEATRLRAKLAIAREAGHRMDARAYELRLCDVERAIAIHNRRATEAEDQRAAGDALDPSADLTPEQLDGMEIWDRDPEVFMVGSRAIWAMLVRRAVAEIRRRRAHPALTADEVRAAVVACWPYSPRTSEGLRDGFTAALAEKLAGRVVSAEQRDAEFVALREALHRRLQEVGDLRPVVVAAEAWRDGVKGLGSHVEQDLEAAVDHLRSKPSGSVARAAQAQREADLRAAFLAGSCWFRERWPDDDRDPRPAAVEYARSKAGG